jgi:hypothetical protein
VCHWLCQSRYGFDSKSTFPREAEDISLEGLGRGESSGTGEASGTQRSATVLENHGRVKALARATRRGGKSTNFNGLLEVPLVMEAAAAEAESVAP